jgi:hypothetical protein
MSRFLKSIILLLTLVPPFGFAAGAAQAEKRIALVIGNAGYQAGALNTPANDAGLIAKHCKLRGSTWRAHAISIKTLCDVPFAIFSTRLRPPGRTRSPLSTSLAMDCSLKVKITSSRSTPR